ncbi:MAG: glycine betaine/proline transport system permease protein [Gaiellaceae bacterium]|jgi:glycine betaine/proline transport system permease protein|nr:glycine betaine/proline transport system permease protein [Gaiellaceae bacterium]MDX6470218.1 glycine betaine/proline transport system permease protein [Gaiellaceae bacterium]
MAVVQAAGSLAAPAPRPWWRGRIGALLALAVGIVIAFFGWKNQAPWPAALTWHALSHDLDNFQAWLSNNRNIPHPSVFFRVFNAIASFLDNLVSWLTSFFLKLKWTGTTVLGTLVVLRFGGRRAALGVLAAFVLFALMGLWEPTVQTFALTLASVTLSLGIGLPLGVLAGRSDRFQRLITPVLDAMQIVPAFAYLMPIVILFSVGPGAAVATTLIYAIPPAIRITSLGIRGVPTNTVEAAEALGATRLQTLTKVQLPLARRMLLLSVNQTILFALSMVVIAGLIGGNGLGSVVTNGLYSDPAQALVAGAAIVVMAIALDRATEAMANRTDPTHRHLTEGKRRTLRIYTLLCAAAVGLAVGLGYVFGAGSVWSRWTASDWLLGRVQSVLDYVQSPSTFIFHITSPVGNFLVQYGLSPLRSFFVETPWPAMVFGLAAIAFLLSGVRPAVITLVMLAVIGVSNEWTNAMDTLSQVLVATIFTLLVGIPFGVWAAESVRARKAMRPVLDVLQTLPQLVYIIPFIYLMPVSLVPGVLASVLYAAPVVIRLVEAGVREVSPHPVEAAESFGATRLQTLLKVKIPLARDAIMLGVNQGIIMVLAVVVIAGLVGSGALGYDVAQGLQQSLFGQGVLASVAILALGITLDRITQGKRHRRIELT